MRDVPELIAGYQKFLETRYPQEAALYRTLAEEGQKPKTMVVACCDSRADPSAIFNARPGELFIVRNVANLVPPHEPHGDYHGTSAALEFAVEGLQVENILVMGHARCGGIKAFLDGLYEPAEEPGFIDRWMSLLNPARNEALRTAHDAPAEKLQETLEHAAIRHSLENLKTFPCVKRRLADGSLRLRGAYFDIATGSLLALNPETNRFESVE